MMFGTAEGFKLLVSLVHTYFFVNIKVFSIFSEALLL